MTHCSTQHFAKHAHFSFANAVENMNFSIAAILVLVIAGSNAKVSYSGYQVLRVQPSNENERLFLEKLGRRYDLQFWRGPEYLQGPIDVMVSKEKQSHVTDILDLARIEHFIMVEDVQELIFAQVSPREAQFALKSFDYNKYHTFEEITSWITNFASANSDSVTKMRVGETYENRTFYGLKISTGGSSKRAFAIDCGIHADEWIGPATCIHVAKFLVDSIGKGDKVSMILDAVDFYIIPSANPDGYAYSWNSDRMWRKTRSPTANPKCYGVDPNRNWDANWSGPGASNDPCNDDYYGKMVFSEANVRAQRDFVKSIPNLQGYIDVHSYSQLWMFPYSYTKNLTKDNHLLSKIANESVAAIKAAHGMVYTPGPIARTIYIASGSTADYFYIHKQVKCTFAAELRDTGKHGMLLPESEIQPTAEEAFAGLLVIAEHIKNGQCEP